MATFHPFPRLPLELREQIWKGTVEPRTVEIRARKQPDRQTRLTSSTPVPAMLHSCREARNLGLYQQARFVVDTHQGREWRYVWLNWDVDTVDMGTSEFRYYNSIASRIKRLRFSRENGDEFFYNTEKRELMKFVNAEEIYVDCADGLWMWGGAYYEHAWPCGRDNVVFIDSFDGRVAKGLELETICRQMLKEQRLAMTGEAYSTDEESED